MTTNLLACIPTVQQINLEHQLANSKANEAVQHATNCGLMLLQVKASLAHGEWLPWLTTEIESGRLKVKARQTRSYMQLAANWQRDANLIEAPSIRAALELLSDKEPDTEQADLIPVDVEPMLAAPAASAATVAALLAELPETDQRAVLENVAAAGDLKVVRADAMYVPISQKRHEWYTPAEYVEAARDVMGGIDLDPASCEDAQSTVQAGRFFSKEQDGLAQPWHGRVWLNPPFEAAVIAPFVAKLIADFQSGSIAQAVILTDSATDTKWFHDLANAARLVCFTKGRINFYSSVYDDLKTQSPRRGQALTYLGDRPDAFATRFKEFGLIAAVQ
ncbi:MAG: hypothetical protein IPL99_15565 [Candidatus Competibacteraceae bacterium]|nr:hypothetical protein [Candidatus Competibacteraceae bacterium]